MAAPPNRAHGEERASPIAVPMPTSADSMRRGRRSSADQLAAREDEDADEDDQAGDPEEGAVDSVKRRGAHRGRDRCAFFDFEPLQKQRRAEGRADKGAEAVERLAECQSEMASLGRSQRGRKRICSNLEDGDPAGHHEEAEQHHLVDCEVGSNQHDDTAGHHHR